MIWLSSALALVEKWEPFALLSWDSLVALIEKRQHLGGTCLNVGCIPTKALLASAKTWSKLQQAPELGFETGEISYNWEKILARKDKIVDQQRKGLRFLMKKKIKSM